MCETMQVAVNSVINWSFFSIIRFKIDPTLKENSWTEKNKKAKSGTKRILCQYKKWLLVVAVNDFPLNRFILLNNFLVIVIIKPEIKQYLCYWLKYNTVHFVANFLWKLAI